MAYIGNSPANVGSYQEVDTISSFNGSLTSFALTAGSSAISPAKSGQLLVSLNGVMQEPDDTGTNGFKVSGSNIVFSSAPATGSTFWAMFQGNNVDVGTPSAGTVGTTELSASGTASATTFLRGDNSWVAPTDSTKLPLAGGTMTGNIWFGDNVKANFGVSDDLQIIHDGSNSYITDAGTGNLYLRGTSAIKITDETSSENFAVFNDNGGCSFYYDNLEKLATTTSGVDITGRANGTLTTDNDGTFDMSASNNFKCTPSGAITITFTNQPNSSQSGFILLVNTGGHTVSAASTSKVDANLLATVTAAGTYLVSYFSDGTNVYLTNSAIYT